jgi:quercetin dioxygenase-like cupin family protein
MKFFAVSKDGGPKSHVTGFFLLEIKPLFSIALLRFALGTREAFHSHAFNAVTLWLSGKVIEHNLDGTSKQWTPGQLKYTRRKTFHKVEALKDSWALTFRGPWVDMWREFVDGKFITLTHGRRVVS